MTPLTLITDSREQRPLDFSGLSGVGVVSRGLRAGDYSIVGFEEDFAVERKSLADLIGTLAQSKARERFRRELLILRSYSYAELMIVGAEPADVTAGKWRSKVTPKAIWNTLDCLRVEYRLPVSFQPTEATAAEHVARLAWIHRRAAAKRFEEFKGLVRKPFPVDGTGAGTL